MTGRHETMAMIGRTRHLRTSRPGGRSRRGMTLTEMLVVVVLIGILAAVIVPRITRLTSRNKASEASAVIQRDLERAFSIAARLRRPVYIRADNAARIYQVTDVSGDTLRIIRNLTEKGEIGIQTMTFSPTTVTVQPNGIASAPLTVTITSHGATRVVSMTRVGLIRRSQ